MKVNICVMTFLMFFLLYPAGYADTSMRCGTKLISVGDSKADVLLNCGEPMLKETVGEKEESRRIDIPLTSSESGSREGDAPTDNSDPAVIRRKESVTKSIEHWTYNQGPGTLLRILVFEGGAGANYNGRSYLIRMPGAAYYF
ncbi:MAG: DUF2845 domain-containing protein [Gammaproteobacteria bacterium]|nr:DUF2845 domain-containing protein [Gammaproteobacteria bacterium]